MDYKEDCKIDESALDVEWLAQTELGIKYGEYWAECKDALTRAEEKIKLVRAELCKECYEKNEKPTDKKLETYFRTHKRHIQAKEEWMDAKFKENIADIAKWQISNTRKDALENLVRLHGQSYFAGPNMPRDLIEEAEKKRELQIKTNAGVAGKLKRRIRD